MAYHRTMAKVNICWIYAKFTASHDNMSEAIVSIRQQTSVTRISFETMRNKNNSI